MGTVKIQAARSLLLNEFFLVLLLIEIGVVEMCLLTCQQNMFVIARYRCILKPMAATVHPLGPGCNKHSISANSTGFALQCHQVGSVTHLLGVL